MRRTHPLSRWLAVLAAGLLSVSLVTALVGTPTGDTPAPRAVLAEEKPAAVVPLFGTTEPARNAPVLVLMPDERGVRGWIAGKSDAAGQKVVIRNSASPTAATVVVGEDNTFDWPHATKKNLPVVAETLVEGKRLTAKTTLVPPPTAGSGPTVFFVTDRSAYRPGHTIKFVAFLRNLLPNGEFEAIADRDVTIDLTSEHKKTRATRLKLKADARGRVVGEYTFTDADALDHYALTADGFGGNARVFLGEYRKTKVGLKLTGEVKDGKLHVGFDARDYLDRPVKGAAATYTASVVRVAEPEKLTLDPAAFAAIEGGPPGQEELEALPDDERLVSLAGGVSALTFAGFGSRHVASREGKAEMADGGAKLVLDLNPDWLKGNYTVTVSGVFTDDTGRENRATGTFKLDPKSERGVRVGTAKEVFAAGEKITATLAPFGLKPADKTATTLVVVRLDPQPTNPWVTPQSDAGGAAATDPSRLSAIERDKPKPAGTTAGAWTSAPVFDPVKRKISSVEPVVGNEAAVVLKQPGAYKLLAVTKFPDGTTHQSETGVVVQPPAKLPGVVLHLDKREINSGARLTGTVHTRFAGAKMLLTLRDSQGVKVARPITADGRGVVRLDEQLPANLRYGCSVCVQYPESATVVHADQRDVFVVPTDRTIGVTATVPAEVGPGAEVELGVKLDRQEEVDLTVSVFDESLLGVTGDLSRDIRNYFLADARGQGRAARELAATRVGAVTVAELVERAKALLKDRASLAREPGLEPQLQGLVQRWVAGQLALADVVTLVRLTGFEVYLANPSGYWDAGPAWTVPKTATLADVLRWEKKDTANPNVKLYVSATVVGNVALVGVAMRNIAPGADTSADIPDPWVGYRGQTYPRQFCGAFNCTGFGNPGWNICGGFSCTGFGRGSTFSGPGFSGPGFSAYGWPYGGFGSGINGFNFGGFGAQFGQWGNLGAQFGISGGIGGGGFGGGFGVPSVAGFQGSFSHPAMGGNMAFSQPFVGGQMGMSFGFNRDFGAPIGAAAGAPLPGLGLADEVVRRDFADSAYWSANLRTDATGNATATFKLPDSLTNWRVQVTAVSPKMHVGTGSARFKSTRAVMIWPMLPRTFTEGDTVRVFGTVHNMTDKERTIRAHLKAENGKVLANDEQAVKVPAKGSVAVYWDYTAGAKGFTDLLMSAKCDAGSDASLKKLPVTAGSVEERVTVSGVVGKGEFTLTLPADFDPARSSTTVTVAPTLAADLADTLPYLVDYPYGCVEQTMSRFLPAIRVAHILRQSGVSTIAALEQKLPQVVAQGQKRLIELQLPDGGWGWNGNGAVHEMMTPYALFGLIESEDAGYPSPNANTIPRGMARLKQYLDKMGQEWDAVLRNRDHNARYPVANDALFCLWVYASREKADLTTWFGRVAQTLDTGLMSDSGHAFALELAVKHKKKELADKLAAELRKRAKRSGDHVYWTTAGFSRWADNTTEVTAAVMKALVAHDATDPLIPGVLAYFHGTKRGDRWDSTKDTACVLYALCDYLAAVKAGPAAAGLVKIAVNGADDGNVRLDSATSKVARLNGKTLKPGENVFKITGPDASGGALARVVVAFTRGRGADIPARDHGVKVERTIYTRTAIGTWEEIKSGATVPAGTHLKVRVTSTPSPGTMMTYTLLESPKPAGCETIAADDPRYPVGQVGNYVLREDREAMTCFHYEQANGPVTAEYVVLTEFAGEFRVAPARVELMYKPTVGGHSDSFTLKVEARKEK